MKTTLLHPITLTLTAALMLSGCTRLGPDFHGVDHPPLPKQWQQHPSKHSDVVTWWRTFHDPALNRLVAKAYAQNLDIKSAGLRIAQARAALGIAQGLAFPQSQKVNATGSTSKTGLGTINTADISFDMGWEIDLWGKYARGIEASEANLYASVATYDNIMVSVIAEVARNYINYRTAQERLTYAKRNVIIQERVTKMTEIQFNSGNVSELDVQQARTQLYSTKTSIPAIEMGKIKARNALALLLGTSADKIDAILGKGNSRAYNSVNRFIAMHKGVIQLNTQIEGLTDINMIPKPKLDPHYRIDANLITQRPDVKTAEYLVHTRYAELGSSMAALYPSFSLFGSIGYHNTDKFGSWLTGNDPLGVTIGPSFSWNIFNYGQIKNQIRLKDARLEESLVNYNKTVLSAVAEVDTALETYVLTRKQQQENRKAVEATIRAFNLSVIQYNDGLVNYQRLLTTVEKLTATQDRFAVIKGNTALSAVALYKALGGGWQMSRGKRYLSKETAARMKSRTDWGNMLDGNTTILPKGFTHE